MPSVAHLSVLDYAMRFAEAHGYRVQLTDMVPVGAMDIDARSRDVRVHPDSAEVTLQMNTVQGRRLPGAYDAQGRKAA